MKVSTYLIFFNLIISFLLLLFVLPRPSFAATFYDTAPPSGSGYKVVADELCGVPGECANSQNSGNCGLPACTGGSAWSKYELTCVLIVDEGRYDSYYERGPQICSIADKCDDGSGNRIGPYLRAGYCNCTVGGIYKTCCTNSSPSYVSGGSCVQVSGDTTNPPWEGVCPGGTSSVQCGFGGLPSCGQEACGPLPPPPPPPPAPGCQCTYGEDCTTTDGRAGTRACGGINDGGVCKWDSSGACNPNCTTCIASAQGGSSCGQNGCQTSLGETCSNCPRDCGNCSSGSWNPPPTRCTMPGSQKGMMVYVDPRSGGDRGDPGKFVQGDIFTVTATGEKGDWFGQKFGCTQDIRLRSGGAGFNLSSCIVVGGFKCTGDGGFQPNPKDNRACWFQWECRAQTPGTYNLEVEATHYDPPKTCDDECKASKQYTVTASGRIKGSIFVDSNGNGLLDSGEKIIRNSSTPCSGANYVTDDSFSIGISGTKTMTIQPRLCNTASSDTDQQVPYFDTGLILPTGGYTVRLNYNTSLWTSTNGDSRNITNPTQNQRTLFGVKPANRLPIGIHEGNYGTTADSNQCVVAGWTSDPDGGNPIKINIYANGTKIVSGLVAETGRPDLTAVCPPEPGRMAGACSFRKSIKSLISPATAYTIQVKAIDAQTGAESNLPDYPPPPGQPSTITCTNPYEAWVQTIGGDVHSNGRINMPGGP